MDPTVRLLRLLTLLGQRPHWSGDELAERLGVTSRTVRRDIARVRELGYAVDAAPGPDGGYRLQAGSVLPPLVLLDDEAVLLAVGLRAAALCGLADTSETAVSARAKLEGLLPARLRSRVQALYAEVVSLAILDDGAVDLALLATLALACRRKEYVALRYVDARGRTTDRDVAPLRIVQADRRWYLVAFDPRRDDWRTFRVDRIEAAEALGGQVHFPDPPDPAALVAEGVALAPYRWSAQVRLHLPYAVAARRISPTLAQLTPESDETTLLRIAVHDLDWIARELVGFGCELEVLAPRELVGAIQRLGRELAASEGHLVLPSRDGDARFCPGSS